MTPECEQVLDLVGEPLPAPLAAHAAACGDCRALREGFGALEAPPSSAPPALESARRLALAELAASPRPTPWWHELALLLAVDAAVVAAGLLALGRKGLVLNAAPAPVVLTLALLLLLVVGGGALLALAPLRRPRPWGALGLGVAGLAVAQVLCGSGLSHRPLLSGTLRCLGLEVGMSVAPLAVAMVLLRRAAFTPGRALAAGLSAAGAGLLVLHLHCPTGTVAHVLWGHVAPWLALAGLAVLVRSRMGSRSYAP
ncbi:DUF1109 domain-containing protein [Corallococcus sp. H22C18031201]|uniref:NrsF family protein n=1 Tax=Citreicoccus inhibens TaxID=2849499 RepID=UPI000E752F6C|nr:NrsF family protein [Citreicoccus inhibens]MBU8895387.1 DUF1109 family protein [Citreicoccus inhibens]RJS22572.1 DUF1109 domain-containing protein [Corallococcus sp. H22C18031201]